MVVVGGVTGDVKKCITCFHHLCQPYRNFGKRQRTILSGTTCAARVQSGVRSTKCGRSYFESGHSATVGMSDRSERRRLTNQGRGLAFFLTLHLNQHYARLSYGGTW